MLRHCFTATAALTIVSLVPLAAQAGGSSSWVDVGRGHANSGAATDSPMGIAQSESRVGRVNMARGLAVGFGPDGLSISHSIGVNDRGLGVGHNFNMSVGRNGTHVGQGHVVTGGPNGRVFTGGETRVDRFGARGGNYAGGQGQFTRAWTRNRSRRH